MLSRRLFSKGLIAGTGVLVAGCGTGSGERQPPEGALLDHDGAPVPSELLKAGPLGDRTFGRAEAPVTIIEYASLTCRYCRQFHLATYPKIKRAYIDTGKVRYIIREFPIGRSAAAAAIINRCAPAKSYMRYYDTFLLSQKQWGGQEVRQDAIFKVAAKAGMTRGTFDKCMSNQAIIDGLMWVKERGRKFGVAGTPTFFINGKKMRGALTFDQMKALIEPQVT
jgi:protein-disulfide isomerase